MIRWMSHHDEVYAICSPSEELTRGKDSFWVDFADSFGMALLRTSALQVEL
jgi:hypothetical protein